MNKEEVEKYYNEKIIAKENIDKEELIYSIASVFTTMNNFEDLLCDDMQDKIANIKQYIEQLENKVKEQEENSISKRVIEEKIEELEAERKQAKQEGYAEAIIHLNRFCKIYKNEGLTIIKAIEVVLEDRERLPKENIEKEEIREIMKNINRRANEAMQAEIEKKDKMIGEMAEYVSHLDIDEDICKEVTYGNGCDDINREVECKECIVNYFERKVKE